MGDTSRQPQVAHNGVRTLLKMLMDRSDVHSALMDRSPNAAALALRTNVQQVTARFLRARMARAATQGSSLFCIRLGLPQRAPLRF